MAVEKPRKEEPAPEKTAAFANQRRNLMTVCVVGGLMLMEGAGIFVAVKFLGGGPASSAGAQGEGSGEAGQGLGWLPSQSEVQVTDLVAFNSQDGRVSVYQMSVYAYVDGKNAAKVKELIEARRNTIDDRLSKVVRAADPKYMSEPGLETLKRQFKHELTQIIGEEFEIREILFPEFSKSRAD